MSLVYLNGEYLPLEKAKISPLDRGFLFGEGIYEVVPSHEGNLVGWELHISRLLNGLAAINIDPQISMDKLKEIVLKVRDSHTFNNIGIYVHVTRGSDVRRYHGYPDGLSSTVFVMAFQIPALKPLTDGVSEGYRVQIEQDKRWKNCHIKSTSLLGNVMHYQSAHEKQLQETLLIDDKGMVTEASSSNVFIVKGNEIVTPPTNHQILPGITRHVLLDIVKRHTDYEILEREITKTELFAADEVWLTSSSRGVAPVIECDGQVIGSGKVGDKAVHISGLFIQHLSDY